MGEEPLLNEILSSLDSGMPVIFLADRGSLDHVIVFIGYEIVKNSDGEKIYLKYHNPTYDINDRGCAPFRAMDIKTLQSEWWSKYNPTQYLGMTICPNVSLPNKKMIGNGDVEYSGTLMCGLQLPHSKKNFADGIVLTGSNHLMGDPFIQYDHEQVKGYKQCLDNGKDYNKIAIYNIPIFNSSSEDIDVKLKCVLSDIKGITICSDEKNIKVSAQSLYDLTDANLGSLALHEMNFKKTIPADNGKYFLNISISDSNDKKIDQFNVEFILNDGLLTIDGTAALNSLTQKYEMWYNAQNIKFTAFYDGEKTDDIDWSVNGSGYNINQYGEFSLPILTDLYYGNDDNIIVKATAKNNIAKFTEREVVIFRPKLENVDIIIDGKQYYYSHIVDHTRSGWIYHGQYKMRIDEYDYVETNYYNGKITGLWTAKRIVTDELSRQGNYVDGIKVGLWKEGTIFLEGGIPGWLIKEYDTNGSLIRTYYEPK